MTSFKSFLSLFMTFIIIIFTSAYIMFLMNDNGIEISEDIITESGIYRFLCEYNRICSDFLSLVIPDAVTRPIKSTAEVVFSAVKNIFFGSQDFIASFLTGNM